MARVPSGSAGRKSVKKMPRKSGSKMKKKTSMERTQDYARTKVKHV